MGLWRRGRRRRDVHAAPFGQPAGPAEPQAKRPALSDAAFKADVEERIAALEKRARERLGRRRDTVFGGSYASLDDLVRALGREAEQIQALAAKSLPENAAAELPDTEGENLRKAVAEQHLKNGAGSIYGPDKAVDDDTQTRWATADEVRECWLDIDLRQPQTIDRITIRRHRTPRGPAAAMTFSGGWRKFARRSSLSA